MGILEAIVLGIVQGATEFLPISSSGHLVLVPAALGWDAPPLVFDTTVHLATLIAVVAVFWRDILGMLTAWWRGLCDRQPFRTVESRLAWWVIVGTVPGVLAGVLLEKWFESFFDSPRAVGGFLLLTALLLVLAEVLGRRVRDLARMNWLDGLLIGIGQAAAIAPGVSRSGATIAVGMYRGLTRDAAARFSFLLAIPIIAGAGALQLYKMFADGGPPVAATSLFAGFVVAAIAGYIAIKLLLVYVRRRPLYPFAVYCVAAGILAIVFF